jgi:hypothetical protein
VLKLIVIQVIFIFRHGFENTETNPRPDCLPERDTHINYIQGLVAEKFGKIYKRKKKPKDIKFTEKEDVIQLCARSQDMASFLNRSLAGAVSFHPDLNPNWPLDGSR